MSEGNIMAHPEAFRHREGRGSGDNMHDQAELKIKALTIAKEYNPTTVEELVTFANMIYQFIVATNGTNAFREG